MKHLTLAAAALALFLGTGPLTPAHADEPTPEEAPAAAETETTETTESKTIQWIEGWEAGKAEAAKRGKLMLVYVHRTSPP